MAYNYIQNMRTCHFIAIKLFSQILSHNLFIVVLGKCFYMPYKWYLGTFYSCHVLTTKEKNEKNFFVLRINDTNVYIFFLMRMIISNILGITIDFYILLLCGFHVHFKCTIFNHLVIMSCKNLYHMTIMKI